MKSPKRMLLTLAGVVGLAALLTWQFRHNPEWRQFSWAAVWRATRGTEPALIVGGIALIYLSYLIRAWRWQMLMTPHGRFGPVGKGQAIGFTATAFLGRAGEMVRPYYIARKERSQFSPQLAVWVLERTLDMAGVVFLVGLDLGLSPSLKALTQNGGYEHAFRHAGVVVSVFVIAVLGLLYWFHLRSAGILGWLRRRNAAHPAAFRRRLIGFLETLAHGTAGLTRGQTLLWAGLYTVLLWMIISTAIWLTVLAYPRMLPGFGLADAVLLMGLTAVGAIVQLPAVGGGFQVLTIFGLTKLFGAATAAATSAALILWLVCIYSIAPLGMVLTAHEGISWRTMEREAERAEARS